MKTKKFSRFLCLFVTIVMMFTMLPKMSITAYAAAEQFNIAPGCIYYFDLSGEAGTITNGVSDKLGTINTAVPDTSLHYVPFTYAGTVSAYSLETADNGVVTTQSRANARQADRSLFVADFNISHSKSWNDLNANNLIFGKTFDTNYTLRSLSMGSYWTGSGDAVRGTPTTNEWDSVLDKSTNGIKNWNGIYTLGQDTGTNGGEYRACRGYQIARRWDSDPTTRDNNIVGFRPALEVKNPTALGAEGLKAVTLNLNGGTFNSASSINIICAGGTFKAPSNEGLTRPSGNTGTSFGWNTQANGKGVSYAVGVSVPKGVNTLYAQWENSVSEGAYYDVVGGTGTGSHLEGSLDVVVTEPTEGITTADKTAGNVSLKLTVAEKTVTDTPDSEKIEGVKQGDTVQYYDVKVEKTVTPSAGNPTTTRLTSIPKPVQAIIPVPQEIQGKTSYTVYRVHNTVAEKIPNDPTAPEFYTVNEGGTSLTLHVNKFSTYAVITGNKALSGDGTLGDVANPINSALDVQGKILEGLLGVYKLDVSWGAMKFDYNASGGVWDPVNHSYTTGGTKGWTNESFENGNNKITVANHSNGDVKLSYVAKPDAVLAGTTMTVRTTNSLAGDLAVNVLLAKVPTEGGAVPTTDTFVWLTGEPTNLATLNGKTYTKAGVITITAEPDKTSGLTPKTTTP